MFNDKATNKSYYSKLSVLPEAIYRFHLILVKIPFFCESDSLILTYVQKYKEPIISKQLKKKTNIKYLYSYLLHQGDLKCCGSCGHKEFDAN